MKATFILLTTCVLSLVNAQVGIDTSTPKATLDAMASPLDMTKPDGVIAPRLTGQELKTKDDLYDTPQTGAIVYITEALDGNGTTTSTDDDTTIKTGKVKEVGYYYFDGTLWKPFHKEPWNVLTTDDQATEVDQNIYHLGKTTIGSKYVANANLNVFTDTDVSSNEYSIQHIILDKDASLGNGFNQLYIASGTPETADTSTNLVGFAVVLDDASSLNRNVNGASFSYSSGPGVDKPDKLIKNLETSTSLVGPPSDNGMMNVKSVNDLSSNLIMGSYSNLTVQKDATAISGKVQVSGTGTYNFNVDNNGLKGAVSAGVFENILGSGSNGTTNLVNGYGVDARMNIRASQTFTNPTVNATNIAGIRSLTNFAVGSTTASYDIENLYGLLIDKNLDTSVGNITIDNVYGIYIKEFLLGINQTIDEASYNLYSEGTNGRNVFEGRIGVGSTSPAAKVHIIKEANASMLTPVIIEGLPTYDSGDSSAIDALPSGGLYKDGAGFLKVKS